MQWLTSSLISSALFAGKWFVMRFELEVILIHHVTFMQDSNIIVAGNSQGYVKILQLNS